jgi:hypothetical protein
LRRDFVYSADIGLMFTSRRKTVKKSMVAALLWLGSMACAMAAGGIAEISIYDRSENRSLPVYSHEGRYYVAGKPGNEYQINVRNRQPGDVLAVISVDGVNAVSGETANWSQTGYVLSPHASFGIRGWRKSTQRIAAFYFTELENSYAARSGRPDHVGVIGVAVFRRKAESAVGISRGDYERRAAPAAGATAREADGVSRDTLGSAAAESAVAPGMRRDEPAVAAPRAPQPAEKSLGTGHGRSETSVVRYTSFERASPTPDEVITVYYDSYRNLVARGVIHAPVISRPSPFPGQFVPDPR